MKAVQIKDYGHSDAIEIVDIEKPVVEPGKVVVQVYAASLNPFDTMVREGHARQMAELSMPATLGADLAGVITDVGSDVTSLNVGDKVYGQSMALTGNSGALAEFAVTSADRVAVAPSNLSLQEAASLPLVGVSALQALTEHIQPQQGEKLFILGASGGIGSAAIQIAKNLGLYVAAGVKGDKAAYVTGLGADVAIDTTPQDYTEALKDYDYVLVLASGPGWDKLFSAVKAGGVLVSLVGRPDEAAAAAHQATGFGQMTDTTATQLNALRELVERGIVTPQVAQVFPLQEARQAFDKREAGGVDGKIVVEIKA